MSSSGEVAVGVTAGGDRVPLLVNADGSLATSTAGTSNAISTLNSRAPAALAPGAVFQGVGEDVSQYGRVGVAIISDNATDGVLTMEVSQDGVTWGGPTRGWADTRFAAPHMWNIVEQYFRIKYTNGTTAATNLGIQVQYSTNADVVLGHQLNEILDQNVEAQVTRPGTDFDLDTARRHIGGDRSFFFFGHKAVVTSAGAWTDIHPAVGDIQWRTAATTVEVLSSSAADAALGLGVQSVEIHGLSATGEDQDEVIAMNGVTPVVSALSYFRVNKLHSETCGTYGGSHQGDITCRPSGGGVTLSKMTGAEGAVDVSVQYGSGEAGNGYWSVPLGKVMYITSLEVIPDVSGNRTISISLYEREDILTAAGGTYAPRREVWGITGIASNVEKVFKAHRKIKALTDIWFRATASGAAAVEVEMEFYLVDADSEGA